MVIPWIIWDKIQKGRWEMWRKPTKWLFHRYLFQRARSSKLSLKQFHQRNKYESKKRNKLLILKWGIIALKKAWLNQKLNNGRISRKNNIKIDWSKNWSILHLTAKIFKCKIIWTRRLKILRFSIWTIIEQSIKINPR